VSVCMRVYVRIGACEHAHLCRGRDGHGVDICVQVRHGQYVEGGNDDSTQVLTGLGRRQAELTGKRLAHYLPQVK